MLMLLIASVSAKSLQQEIIIIISNFVFQQGMLSRRPGFTYFSKFLGLLGGIFKASSLWTYFFYKI